MTSNSNSDRSPTSCSSGLKSISRKESEYALALDGKMIKVATEHFTATTDPDHVQQEVGVEEERAMYKNMYKAVYQEFPIDAEPRHGKSDTRPGL